MSNNFIGEDDLVLNTSSRVPVCLCLDVSGSMSDCIGELNEGVNEFYAAVKRDDTAASSCEIAIVTFESYVKLEEDFSTVDKKSPVALRALGGTDMAGGVRMALDILEKRKARYKETGVDYFQPWFIIMSDGAPMDRAAVKALQETTKALEADKKLVIFPICIGDGADHEIMSGFSNKRRPIRLKDHKFSEFFEWLGKSVSVVSASQVGDKIKLDTSTIADWGDL